VCVVGAGVSFLGFLLLAMRPSATAPKGRTESSEKAVYACVNCFLRANLNKKEKDFIKKQENQ
jgi:hypothetical protein